jgi:hypothetical protein
MTVGEISSFSSPGPTRPNSKGSNPFGKPDITAPGEYILSSLSSQMDNPPADHFWVSDSMHRALRGTSMAAPHVTGVVALMLEREPQLLPAEIRGRLILSARKDAFTGNEWNRYWGYGKLDGYAAVAGTPVSIREDPVSGIDARMPAVFPNPFNHSTRISVDLNHSAARDPSLDLTIYALDGRKIRTLVKGPVPAGRLHAVWDGRDDRGRLLPTGMYFCYLRYSGVRQTAKISLIR